MARGVATSGSSSRTSTAGFDQEPSVRWRDSSSEASDVVQEVEQLCESRSASATDAQ